MAPSTTTVTDMESTSSMLCQMSITDNNNPTNNNTNNSTVDNQPTTSTSASAQAEVQTPIIRTATWYNDIPRRLRRPAQKPILLHQTPPKFSCDPSSMASLLAMMNTWDLYYEYDANHIRWELGMCTRDYFMDHNIHVCARYEIFETILAEQIELREYYYRQWSSVTDSLKLVRKNKNKQLRMNSLTRSRTEKELSRMLKDTNRILRQVMDIGEAYYNEFLALRWFESALVHVVNHPEGPTELSCRVLEKLEESSGIARGDRMAWFQEKKRIKVSKWVKVLGGEEEGKFRKLDGERVVWDCGYNCRYDGDKAHLHPSERIYGCEGCDVRLIKVAEDLERHRGDRRAYFECVVMCNVPQAECICAQEQEEDGEAEEDEEEGEEDGDYEPSNGRCTEGDEEDIEPEEEDEEDNGEYEVRCWIPVERNAGEESAEPKDENMDMDAPYEQEDGGEGSNCGCLNCS